MLLKSIQLHPKYCGLSGVSLGQSGIFCPYLYIALNGHEYTHWANKNNMKHMQKFFIVLFIRIIIIQHSNITQGNRNCYKRKKREAMQIPIDQYQWLVTVYWVYLLLLEESMTDRLLILIQTSRSDKKHQEHNDDLTNLKTFMAIFTSSKTF